MLADYLVLQRQRANCGIASPVIAALGGQNAKRQSEQKRGGDSDYALGHHRSPLGFPGHATCMSVYSRAVCDGRHKFGEWRSKSGEAAAQHFREANAAFVPDVNE
jgi:hypothetical protein